MVEVMEVQETLPGAVEQTFESYTVGKNDTLQKISKKFYGTFRKWKDIYEANRNILRTPDKLYPGQTLKIPKS
jgi:nucleoid-associated protein YgaU